MNNTRQQQQQEPTTAASHTGNAILEGPLCHAWRRARGANDSHPRSPTQSGAACNIPHRTVMRPMSTHVSSERECACVSTPHVTPPHVPHQPRVPHTTDNTHTHTSNTHTPQQQQQPGNKGRRRTSKQSNTHPAVSFRWMDWARGRDSAILCGNPFRPCLRGTRILSGSAATCLGARPLCISGWRGDVIHRQRVCVG